MSPSELLKKLDALGTIDEKMLRKIHRQVESPDKVVKVSAVLKFLMKHDQISESQARELMKEAKRAEGVTEAPTAAPTVAPDAAAPRAVTETPASNAATDASAPKAANDFEVAPEPVETDYDTGDLTSGVGEESPPAVPVVAPDPELIAAIEPEIAPEEATEPAEAVEPEVDAVEEVAPAEKKRNKKKQKKEKRPAPEPEPVLVEQTGMDAGMLDETMLDAGDDFGDASELAERDSGKSKGFVGKLDKSNQWATKWVFIGFGTLAMILIATGVLWLAVSGVKAEEQYKAAQDSFRKLAYDASVKQFDEYIKNNPNHEDYHTAVAVRAQAVLRSSYERSQWETVLKRAEVELPPLADVDYKESKLASIRNDLAVMLPASLRNITDDATQIKDVDEMKAARDKINQYRETVENRVYIPESQRKVASNAKVLDAIENNIKTLTGHINKEQDYTTALVDINQLASAGETDQAFQRFRKLTRNYGDLGSREELQELMLTVSERESDLVKSVESETKVSQSPAQSAISRSVVLASKSGTPIEGLRGEMLAFVAEGSAYGLDASDGSIVWRRFVGYQAEVQPQRLDDGSLVIVDAARNDLLRINQRTGDVVWRAEIGQEMFTPNVAGTRITVSTADGRVLNLDSQTGRVAAAVQLPQIANTPASGNERNPYIYQAGSYSNLYVLSAEDLACQEVYYTGHGKGSVVVAPYLWSGYVLVAINSGDDCDLHVLKPTADGLGLRLVQLISRVTTGPITTPLARFGRWLFLIADNGDMRLLELDASNETNPVRPLAADRVDNSSKQRLFALTEGNNLWVSSEGILRYRIKRAEGQFAREVVTEPTDVFITPMQTIDDNLFHVRRREGSRMVSASLVDKQTLKPIWRTDFGGALAGSPVKAGDGMFAFNNQGDAFAISEASFQAGASSDAVRSSEIVENLEFKYAVKVSDDLVSLIGPEGRGDALSLDVRSGKTRLFTLETPADAPACRPLALDGKLIVPSLNGQVVRVAPSSGRMFGTPFQPAIKPGATTRWFAPVAWGQDEIAVTSAGTGGSDSSLHVVSAASEARLSEVASYRPTGVFASGPVVVSDLIYAIVRQSEQDAIVALRPAGKSLELADSQNLDAQCVDGPWAVADRLLMVLASDQLVSVSAALQPEWSVALPNDKIAFPPTMTGRQLMVGFQSGLLVWIDPATGKVVNQKQLGQPINGPPLLSNGRFYFGGLDGTVHEVDPSAW